MEKPVISRSRSLSESERNIRGIDLVFQNINLTINKQEVLHNVFGAARHGDMLALMGPSGSGKTSLLNAIAGSLQLDSGEILANGVKFTKTMRRQMCYVLQQDIFFPMLTLKETLIYSALLRLPDRMPWKEKKARVDEIIDALDLRKCEHTIIGSLFKRGLSGGEKKRANIACELLTNPSLMLMDEPTSGLDSTSAHTLMSTMKRYSQAYNKTVITAIHQPSSQTFHSFDKVLLLCDGKVAYYGRGSEIMEFFERINLPCQPHYNPADFILDQVKSGEVVQEKIIAAGQAIETSDFWLQEMKELGSEDEDGATLTGIDGGPHTNDVFTMENGDAANAHGPHTNDVFYMEKGAAADAPAQHGLMRRMSSKLGFQGLRRQSVKLHIEDYLLTDIDKYYDPKLKYQTSFLTQFRVLFVRNIKHARYRVYNIMGLVRIGVIGAIVSLLWFQLPKTEETLKDRLGALFFVPTYWGFVLMFDNIGSYPFEQTIIMKERAAGAYHLLAYMSSKFLSEIILYIPIPLAYLAITFWAIGLNGVAAFFITWALMCFEIPVILSASFAFAVAKKGPQPNLTPAIIYSLFAMLAGGFFTTKIPFWLDWIKYLSYARYLFDSIAYLEFTNAPPIRCAVNSSLSMFEECRVGVNVTHVKAERFLEMTDSLTIWQNILCLSAFMVIFRVAAYIILRFIRCPPKNN